MARSGRLALAAVLLCGLAGGAQARGGFFDFFGRVFGGDDGRPEAQPDDAPPGSHPLTVRAHPRRHRLTASRGKAGGSGGRYNVADLKGVTIYTDRTLSRGDIVMTASGIKVFNGSGSWPYTDDDFVALTASGKMPPAVRQELTSIDNASRRAPR